MTAGEVLGVALLTLRVGFASTAMILLPGIALGRWLARTRSPARALVQTLVSLPMVLPPVAVGLVLLHLLSRRSPTGRALEALLGSPLLLTWWAAAIASAAMSFPLLVHGARQGFAAVPVRLERVASSLGAPASRVFLRVSLPLAARGILHGAVFAFARGLGEFGATTLVAGHVPGETETLALAIYARIERFEEGEAFLLAAVSAALAFSITAAAEVVLRRDRA
ncbi:MAG TPA: molybdate ABC transporter permease subunit [Planctomycetota bacterium]|jgi:molybdate transport system permease protein|nr:molybdate ABC transporter permease subunit [Planctomycetota bacterium]